MQILADIWQKIPYCAEYIIALFICNKLIFVDRLLNRNLFVPTGIFF